MNDAMHKGKERELRVNGSNANTNICFEVRAPSSTSPPSSRRIFNPLTYPPRTPTEGTSTEDFVQIQPRVPNSSLNQYNLHRGTTIHLYRRGIQTPTPPHQEGANYNLNLYQRGSKPQPKSTSTKEGYHKSRVYNLVVYLNHKQYLFPQTNDPNRIG